MTVSVIVLDDEFCCKLGPVSVFSSVTSQRAPFAIAD